MFSSVENSLAVTVALPGAGAVQRLSASPAMHRPCSSAEGWLVLNSLKVSLFLLESRESPRSAAV